MLHVRLILPWKENDFPPVERQTPDGSGKWKEFQFHTRRPPFPCDFLVVFGGQRSKIIGPYPKENTLFIAGEPPSIKRYPAPFLAQFGKIICSDDKVEHPNKMLFQQGYPWFSGIWFTPDGKRISVKGYNEFLQDPGPEKTKLVSVVCSSKISTPGHRKRYEFVRKLKEHFGSEIDVFGAGENPVPDKADALRPYKYHVAIENSQHPHYWTEKLSDSFLEQVHPFYYGCTELENYFPAKAFTRIDLENPAVACNQIRESIASRKYEKSLPALRKSKELILKKYNLFNLIAENIGQSEATSKSTNFQAYPTKWFRKGFFGKTRLRLSAPIRNPVQ